jgi:hypothetical protein
MSNLNIEKEYYLNLPITYIDTVGKVENRLKINYTPNSEAYNQNGDVCENMGEYCITLQSKFSWLLDTVPDRYTITHALVSGFADKMTWIKFNIPFLDTVLEAKIKKTGFHSLLVSFKETNDSGENNDLTQWKDIDFPINEIYQEPIWEFKENYSPVITTGDVTTGFILPRLTVSKGKIYIKNILQNNKLINIDTNFTFISTFYEVKITKWLT